MSGRENDEDAREIEREGGTQRERERYREIDKERETILLSSAICCSRKDL